MKSHAAFLRSFTALLSAVCLTAGTVPLRANGNDAGPYLTVDAGVNILQDLTFKPGGGSAEMDTGFRFDFIGGYHLNEWCGVELETGFIYNSVADDADNAWLGQVPILANLVFRYENQSKWTPYVGAGAGGALTIASDDSGDDSDFVFAWQGMAGVTYAINDQMAVDISYKYFGTAEQNYDIGGSFALSDVHNHMVGLSFTWKF